MGKRLKANTEKVLIDRYYLKSPQGELLEHEWAEACARVAKCVASGHLKQTTSKNTPSETEREQHFWEQRFFDLAYDQKFIYNSPTWFNAGNPYTRSMLSACFILFTPDDIPGIFKAVQDGAIIGKFGGGIGMDFSSIRPADDGTSSGGKASGAVSFMGPFQAMGEAIIQGGKRRIAKMGMLSVWHPEILMFIDLKVKTGPERVAWLMKDFGMSREQARAVMIGVDWLRVKGQSTPEEQDEWNSPFNGFNVSVKLTDEFMQAKDNDGLYMLRKMVIPQGENNPRATDYQLVPWRGPVYDPRNILPGGKLGENVDGLVVEQDGIKYIRARQLWYERLMPSAWASAEPGIVFEDVVNRDNPVKSMGWIRNSNPCGEYFQVPYNSCNLGSQNVSKYFLPRHNGAVDTQCWHEYINWQELANDARWAARALDYVITKNDYPLPEITQVTQATRPTGLGVMGFADLLIDLEIRYGSPLSIEVARRIQQWQQYWAWVESTTLAQEFGEFPELENNLGFFEDKMAKLWVKIHDHPAFDTAVPNLLALFEEHGVRNCHVTVIAPTGTISLMAECSSGIEPVFAFALKRQDTVGVRWYYDDRAYAWLHHRYENEVPASLHGNKDATAQWLLDHHDLPEWFVDANQVTPEEHVLIQAAFQEFCDNAISKTVNMPAGATVEDVARVYDSAYQHGLKGCTVYRDESREGVLLRTVKSPGQAVVLPPQAKPVVEGGVLKVMDRPAFLEGGTYAVSDGHDGKLYVTINYEPQNGRIFEVFLRENTGNEWIELAGRTISLLLRSNVQVQEIRQQLRRVGGQSTIWYNGKCFSSAVQLLDEVIFHDAQPFFVQRAKELPPADLELAEPTTKTYIEPLERGPKCPDCSGPLRSASGCMECINPTCGYSKCK